MWHANVGFVCNVHELWRLVLTVNKRLLAFIFWSAKHPDLEVSTQYDDFERDQHEQLNVDVNSVLIDGFVPRAN